MIRLEPQSWILTFSLVLNGALCITALILVFTLLFKKKKPGSDLSVLTGELRQLNDLFLKPKLRGGLGERFLYQLLEDALPGKYWQRQYRFSSGAVVDAVIRLGQFLVPVDSKFPKEGTDALLHNPALKDQLQATKDIRRHIDTIREKYICPQEGTLQFALMYLPSEGLYHSLFIEEPLTLFDYALKSRVIPVSPGSLFIYLQTVSYGLRGLTLHEKGEAILKTLSQLSVDYGDCMRLLEKTEQHARNMNGSLMEAKQRMARLGISLEGLSSLEP
ncbi:MAG: DNA recombination protein RmuC [Spirochaetales bacterium]|nr:DNA recombination protein RmuC [Spirochaetales bacterium]